MCDDIGQEVRACGFVHAVTSAPHVGHACRVLGSAGGLMHSCSVQHTQYMHDTWRVSVLTPPQLDTADRDLCSHADIPLRASDSEILVVISGSGSQEPEALRLCARLVHSLV